MNVDGTRISVMNELPVRADGQCIMYWMQKDQRIEDNWALLRAVELANERDLPVIVAFFVWEGMSNPYVRHFEFMLRGIKETAVSAREHKIGFVMRHEEPVAGVVGLADEVGAAAVITDQAYLKLGKQRRAAAAAKLNVAFEAVDANTIVPPAVVADKALYGAYIIRPKLKHLFPQYLTDYPNVSVKHAWTKEISGLNDQDVKTILGELKLDAGVGGVDRASGPRAATEMLDTFMGTGLERYQDRRNDPVANSTSQLSAYLHYGQISAQRIAFELLNSQQYGGSQHEAIDGYLDELITWRELSVNFCKYNDHYASYDGLPAWARKSLSHHEADERGFLYTRDELERGQTHDELWNAAQMEMVKSGRMHGYMRMYWGKKILEWTHNATEAIEWAIYLNDKYELDGREANGYTGILWAIGGLHDRPWFEREIFGQIRYMSYGGAKSKFKIKEYVAWVDSLPGA